MTPPQASPVRLLAPSPKPEARESGFTSPLPLLPRGDCTVCIGLQSGTPFAAALLQVRPRPHRIRGAAVPPPLMWLLGVRFLYRHQNNLSVRRLDTSLDAVFRSTPILHGRKMFEVLNPSFQTCQRFPGRTAPSVAAAPLPVCAPV